MLDYAEVSSTSSFMFFFFGDNFFSSHTLPQLSFSELASKLDNLVGDIEDAVSSVMNRKRKHPSTHASEVSTIELYSIENLA